MISYQSIFIQINFKEEFLNHQKKVFNKPNLKFRLELKIRSFHLIILLQFHRILNFWLSNLPNLLYLLKHNHKLIQLRNWFVNIYRFFYGLKICHDRIFYEVHILKRHNFYLGSISWMNLYRTKRWIFKVGFRLWRVHNKIIKSRLWEEYHWCLRYLWMVLKV